MENMDFKLLPNNSIWKNLLWYLGVESSGK